MTFAFAPLAWVYLIVGLTTLALTALSRNLALVFGSAIMLASWLVSDEVLAAGGYAGLIAHDAVVCAVMGVCVATVGAWARNRALAVVSGLFFLNILGDIAFLGYIGAHGLALTKSVKFCYAAAVNGIYLAACFSLGAPVSERDWLIAIPLAVASLVVLGNAGLLWWQEWARKTQGR